MPAQQSGKSRRLERQATALLNGSPGLAQKRSAGLISVSDRELTKNEATRRRVRTIVPLLQAYRQLPKAIRRSLTAEFKEERISNPALNWTDWLVTKAEIVHGKPNHEATSPSGPDRADRPTIP